MTADVADLPLRVALTSRVRSVFAVSGPSTQSAVVDLLDDLIESRYGRDGDILRRGYGVTVYEAGLATGVMGWNLRTALDPALAGFRMEQIGGRMDLLFRDLLEHPEDPPVREWALRYGYLSPAAASRAFGRHFGLGIGDVRRMGRLGQWLALAEREPRSQHGRRRQTEAVARIEAFRTAVHGPRLGRRARRAVRELGTPGGGALTRPRYPRIGRTELARLNRAVTP